MQPRIVTLSEMVDGQEGDLFALLTSKETASTKNGSPYYKVTFRDAMREVSFPIWDNSPWAADCRDHWQPGMFFKLRAVYRESNYGPQLDIRKVREVTDEDRDDGFDPSMCRPQSRFDSEAMFGELSTLIEEKIDDQALRELVETILATHRDAFVTWSAARHNHHAFTAGLLEHTLSVTRTCVFLAEKYADYYVGMDPPLDQGMVVAGAV